MVWQKTGWKASELDGLATVGTGAGPLGGIW